MKFRFNFVIFNLLFFFNLLCDYKFYFFFWIFDILYFLGRGILIYSGPRYACVSPQKSLFLLFGFWILFAPRNWWESFHSISLGQGIKDGYLIFICLEKNLLISIPADLLIFLPSYRLNFTCSVFLLCLCIKTSVYERVCVKPYVCKPMHVYVPAFVCESVSV